MIAPQDGSSVRRATGYALFALLAACSRDPAADHRPETSASAQATAMTPAGAPSAAESASRVIHDPGAKLVPAAPPPRPSASAASVALDPPVLTRLARSPGRRAGLAGLASILDARTIAVTGAGEVAILDIESGDGLAIRTGSPIFALDATRAAAAIAIVESTGRTTVWDGIRGTLVRTWQRPEVGGDNAFASLTPDGTRLALASTDLAVFDVESGAQRFSQAQEGPSFSLSFTGTEIAVTTNNLRTASWAVDRDVATGDAEFQTGGTFGVAVSADTRWAAGAAPDGHGLQVADLRSKGSRRQLVNGTTCDAHIFPSFSRDSRFVYAVAGSKSVKGFETGSWKPYASFHAPPGRSIAAFADDLSRVVTTDAEGGDPRVVLVSNTQSIALQPADTFTFSRDGTRVLGASEGAATVWNAADGAVAYVVTR